MLPLLLALAAPASAAGHEISLEFAWIGSEDPAFRLLGGNGTLGSYGLRGGFKVHDNVTIIAGWQHAAHGGSVDSGGDGYYEEDGEYGTDGGYFQAALFTDQITLGSKADVKLWKWLHPYVTAQIAGMRGLVRMDDDSNDDENLTQVERVGLTGGAIGAVGLDFLIRVKGNVYIAPYLEMGYGWYAPMAVEELGTVQFSGFAGRGGLGVRF